MSVILLHTVVALALAALPLLGHAILALERRKHFSSAAIAFSSVLGGDAYRRLLASGVDGAVTPRDIDLAIQATVSNVFQDLPLVLAHAGLTPAHMASLVGGALGQQLAVDPNYQPMIVGAPGPGPTLQTIPRPRAPLSPVGAPTPAPNPTPSAPSPTAAMRATERLLANWAARSRGWVTSAAGAASSLGVLVLLAGCAMSTATAIPKSAADQVAALDGAYAVAAQGEVAYLTLPHPDPAVVQKLKGADNAAYAALVALRQDAASGAPLDTTVIAGVSAAISQLMALTASARSAPAK